MDRAAETVHGPFDQERPDRRGEVIEGDHPLIEGQTVHFSDASRPHRTHAATAARADQLRNHLRSEAMDDEQIRLQAEMDHEAVRSQRRLRQLRDVREDDSRDTIVHRAGQKAVEASKAAGSKAVDVLIPPGSKRRTGAKVAGVTAALAPAAVAGVTAIDAGTDVAARGAMAAAKISKKIAGSGSESPGAPYGEGVNVSQADVEEALDESAAERRLSDAAAEHEAGSGD